MGLRLKPENNEDSKDKKLDKIFWFKFVFSIFFGIGCGVIGMTGLVTFIVYFLATSIISHMYFNKFVTNEENDFQADIFIEGLNVSIPTFILCWILSFTYSKLLI